MAKTKQRLSNILLDKTDDDQALTAAFRYFRNFVPQCLMFAVGEDLSEEQKDWADNIDCLEFYVRGYICGKFNRMHRIYFEIRRFEENLINKECIILMFEEIKEILDENEIYEYMDRFNTVYKKCLKLLNSINRFEVNIKQLKEDTGIK